MREGRFLRIGGYVSGGVLMLFGIAVIALGIWGFAFTATTSSAKASRSAPRPIRPCKSTPSSGRASRSTRAERRSRWPRSCASTRCRAPAGSRTRRWAATSRPRIRAIRRGRTTRPRRRRTRTASRSRTAPATSGSRRTALATALDMGFMSEMLAIFSIIVGIALLLTGIGLVILARAVFGRGSPAAQVASPAPEPEWLPGRPNAAATGRSAGARQRSDVRRVGRPTCRGSAAAAHWPCPRRRGVVSCRP